MTHTSTSIHRVVRCSQAVTTHAKEGGVGFSTIRFRAIDENGGQHDFTLFINSETPMIVEQLTTEGC